MSYEIEELAKALKTARISKNLTQRALSQRAGVPQAHISRIERGAVDLRLSSLIAVARVLDLEVALVPRNVLPAVQSVVRSSELTAAARPASPVVKELQRLRQIVGAMSELKQGATEFAQLDRQIRELQRFPLTNEHLVALKTATGTLQHYRSDGKGTETIHQVLLNLQGLRNAIAHQAESTTVPTAARPAYTLDDEPDNG